MRIKIDLDGVIRDIVTPMCHVYNRDVPHGTKVRPGDIVHYDVGVMFPQIAECEKYDGLCVRDIFFTGENARTVFLDRALIIPGSVEAIRRMMDAGHTVSIVTWQMNEDNIRYAIEFLSRHKVPYDEIMFTHAKEMVITDFAVDDNPEFLEPEGREVGKILIDAPYNKWYDRAVRKNSLADAAEYILTFKQETT